MKYNYTIMVLILVGFLALFASYGQLTLNENTKVTKEVDKRDIANIVEVRLAPRKRIMKCCQDCIAWVCTAQILKKHLWKQQQ